MPTASPARVIMYDNAWTPAQVGRVLSCGELQVTKYLTGYRRLSAIQASYLRREFGVDALQECELVERRRWRCVELLDERFDDHRQRHFSRGKRT